MMRGKWSVHADQLLRLCVPIDTLLRINRYASLLLPFIEEILAFSLRYMPVFYGVVWAVMVACKAG